jgi:hypothetical protein
MGPRASLVVDVKIDIFAPVPDQIVIIHFVASQNNGSYPGS